MTEVTDHRIPPYAREEWTLLITNEIQHTFKSFVFQMRISDISDRLKNGSLTAEEGKQSLYELCQKYPSAVKDDLRKIFKNW